MVENMIPNKLSLIESDMEEINSVISGKILVNEEGNIKEIHILSNGRRNPKQISRDLQSILIVKYNLDVDYKKISIAELPDEDFYKNGDRIQIGRVSFEDKGQRMSVSVKLCKGDSSFETSLEGVNIKTSKDRIIAEATLRTIEKMYGFSDVFFLEDIKTIQLSRTSLVVVVVSSIMEDSYKNISGSCIIRDDHGKAIVRAVLDSLNRYINK